MHPPLDRPHPDCHDAIDQLRDCQGSRSFFNITACNGYKAAMDNCFKMEKAKLLKIINIGMHEKRKQEEDAWRDATGHNESFEEYLNRDQEYKNALKEKESRDPDQYQKRAMGGSLS
mmetsp:Transcript_813/g.982  ORF Transcript_813/g.982 Transcript_813/m.982 type:complete len:117 (-) Transcript_813:165-515(-)|eukprot:CAMPEP_0194147750 /NCGR_PEP_ID=MMETSP0152-20130528/27522_1 /TAXON_ID=1049557 /ORGANISM="Thalassiothrix antarctica, Strain L6-D1" /LENGTH=116 /DNA_ID=CAMNT_0038848789 /DNA_START=141 /DNA_END=491 /DNA_ORIENTATION=-